MSVEEVRKYCLVKNGVSESFPFDEQTLVFKIANKMFCLLSIFPPFSINLKGDPDKIIELKEEHEEIKPGFHMNKKHWITIGLEGNLDKNFIESLIDDSYNLVSKGLTQKDWIR